MPLTFYYDSSCGLCSTARSFFDGQSQRVPVELIDLHTPEAQQQLKDIPLNAEEEILATDHNGNWWQGGDAWILALWSTQKYHKWAQACASPSMRPLAKKLALHVSHNRHQLSKILHLTPDKQSIQHLQNQPDPPPTAPSPNSASYPLHVHPFRAITPPIAQSFTTLDTPPHSMTSYPSFDKHNE